MMVHQRSSEKKGKQGDDQMTDHLANERTMLAWTRTGLTIFTLGCALARFGGASDSQISLRDPKSEKKPVISGLILAICGVLCCFYGLWRFFKTNRQIRDEKKMNGINIVGPMLSMMVLMLALIVVIIIFFII